MMIGAWLTATAILNSGFGWAAEDSARGSIPAIRDFLTQNVCEDATGAVVEGISPVDGDPRCIRNRDLRPGETLPYHKHDHPSPDQIGAAPTGYQRHDSVPVETAQLGLVIEQSFDFGAGQGRSFGVFDESGGDGGDLVAMSVQSASIAATEDGGAGFQIFVGSDCQGTVTAKALLDSWLIARIDGDATLAGEAVARLKDLGAGRQATCPMRLDSTFTRWRIAPFVYRAAPGQGKPFTLSTLISEHFAGADPQRANHVERFYYTRELGSTRWERWENMSQAGNERSHQIQGEAAIFAASRRCAAAAPPDGNASFVMIDCREWTVIVPPAKPGGDIPGFFVNFLRAHRDAVWLAAPKP